MDQTSDNNKGEDMANPARNAGQAASSAAQRVSEGLEQGRAALADVQEIVTERARECLRTTDSYVRENPWQAVGMAAGLGMIIGLLLGRR
jgi:ElaB/YqjD/DUF883 family membrane-anchored ribosome-binding protein